MANHDGPIVLVGGSGVVGLRLALLLGRLEQRPLLIAGRSSSRAQPVLDELRAAGVEARFFELDVAQQPGGETVRVRLPPSASAVVGLVNDPHDALLGAALEAAVPFVDITRWTTRFSVAVGRAGLARPRAPVVLASGWMAGLLPRVAAFLAAQVGGELDSIDGSIRYALADASGADSVEYMDRLWIPFDVTREGRAVTVPPFSDVRRVEVAGALTTVRRLDTPEQWSLPLTLGARSASVRMGFDSGFVTQALAFLVRLGFFRWFSADRFRGLRHSLLRSTGAETRLGAPASFRVDVRNTAGESRTLSLTKADGQAALTAVGAWLALRFALSDPTFAGVRFPEQDPDNADLPALLSRAGVSCVGG